MCIRPWLIAQRPAGLPGFHLSRGGQPALIHAAITQTDQRTHRPNLIGSGMSPELSMRKNLARLIPSNLASWHGVNSHGSPSGARPVVGPRGGMGGGITAPITGLETMIGCARMDSSNAVLISSRRGKPGADAVRRTITFRARGARGFPGSPSQAACQQCTTPELRWALVVSATRRPQPRPSPTRRGLNDARGIKRSVPRDACGASSCDPSEPGLRCRSAYTGNTPETRRWIPWFLPTDPEFCPLETANT